ncbi:MAG: peptide-methionine (R)-S-oxide reductase MsrB [Nitrospirae bacterium]|nr:peptide-methionine (R)-S-oxide reductase MsrB [Candidatus Manganitrophaceae bacterium]
MDRRHCLKMLAGLALLGATESLGLKVARALEGGEPFPVSKSDDEWRASLTPEQYRVLRQEWTEPPFKNKYHDSKEKGTYHCAGCDQTLFSSKTKFDSGTGWPSFWQPMFADAVGTKIDRKLSEPRTEVHCARCGGHLGHIFNDGPAPTFLRYCINSAALTFKPSGSEPIR